MFFDHFLSSKMGRGVLAVAGGSGGKPIFDPKIFQKPSKNPPGKVLFKVIRKMIIIMIIIIKMSIKMSKKCPGH